MYAVHSEEMHVVVGSWYKYLVVWLHKYHSYKVNEFMDWRP